MDEKAPCIMASTPRAPRRRLASATPDTCSCSVGGLPPRPEAQASKGVETKVAAAH